MSEDLRLLLEKYARACTGELIEATLKAASDAHPMLGQLASVLMAEVLTEETRARIVGHLEQLLIEVLGDDYPTKIEANRVVIEDNREG